MTINFDVISDLNLESTDDFTWQGKPTSLFCIVAGNISSDRDTLFEFLEIISSYYEAVFFIDGPLEHETFDGDFDASYASIRDYIEDLDNVFFLHENIIVLPGVALLATNGWTTFDFTGKHTKEENQEFLEARGEMSLELTEKIFKMALIDQRYMYNSIKSCQTMDEVKNLVIVTNAVPFADFVTHDEDYNGTLKGDIAGNRGLVTTISQDKKNKISTWIFGNYPGDIDYNINSIRFVNNPASNKDLSIYYPKVIKF